MSSFLCKRQTTNTDRPMTKSKGIENNLSEKHKRKMLLVFSNVHTSFRHYYISILAKRIRSKNNDKFNKFGFLFFIYLVFAYTRLKVYSAPKKKKHIRVMFPFVRLFVYHPLTFIFASVLDSLQSNWEKAFIGLTVLRPKKLN